MSRVDPKFFLELLLYSDKIVFYDKKIKSLNLTSICLKSDFSIQLLVKLKHTFNFGEVSVQMSDEFITQLPVIHHPFRRQEKEPREGQRQLEWRVMVHCGW